MSDFNDFQMFAKNMGLWFDVEIPVIGKDERMFSDLIINMANSRYCFNKDGTFVGHTIDNKLIKRNEIIKNDQNKNSEI